MYNISIIILVQDRKSYIQDTAESIIAKPIASYTVLITVKKYIIQL